MRGSVWGRGQEKTKDLRSSTLLPDQIETSWSTFGGDGTRSQTNRLITQEW